MTRNVHARRAVAPVLAGLAAAGVAATMVLSYPNGASAADAPVGLGTAANFSVLAGSTVTNTGTTTMAQSLGIHPGSAVTGSPVVGGETHLADDVALVAKNDLTTAYNDAAGRTPFIRHVNELGGDTLTPGVYRIAEAQVTGALTLNAQGNPQAVFIFQVDSTLITAPNSSVVFINGSAPCNVYWKVGSSATLDTGTSFIGNILASASIAMKTGATLQGRALAQTAAVTLDTNTITAPVCAQPTPSPSPTTGPTATPTVTPTAGPTSTPTAGPTATPTAGPTVGPTVTPTAGPTMTPTAGPTPSPTLTPTSSPTASPTATPTASTSPTAGPTMGPTTSPSSTPTPGPTMSPTARPTASHTATPSATPTRSATPVPGPADDTSPGAGPGHRPHGKLPTTGGGTVPILMGTGTALLTVGATVLIALYLRRTRQS
ncbi:ice-binding family protein [Longispora urticae]